MVMAIFEIFSLEIGIIFLFWIVLRDSLCGNEFQNYCSYFGP
jgi:hypothetical protein